MHYEEIIKLELTTRELIKFYIENIKDKDVAEDLRKASNEEYSNIILDIRSNYYNIHSINSVDFKDKFYTETEEEYLELELKNFDNDKIYTYNDVAGFIIKDGVIYTLFQISDNQLVKFILIVHNWVSGHNVKELAQFCTMKKFKNVTVIDFKGDVY